MNIKTEKDNNHLKMILEGDLNTSTAQEVNNAYIADEDGVNDVVIDMEGVSYISSAGLRVILFIQQEMDDIDGSLTVCNINSNVMEVFRLSGFDQFLKIE